MRRVVALCRSVTARLALRCKCARARLKVFIVLTSGGPPGRGTKKASFGRATARVRVVMVRLHNNYPVKQLLSAQCFRLMNRRAICNWDAICRYRCQASVRYVITWVTGCSILCANQISEQSMSSPEHIGLTLLRLPKFGWAQSALWHELRGREAAAMPCRVIFLTDSEQSAHPCNARRAAPSRHYCTDKYHNSHRRL